MAFFHRRKQQERETNPCRRRLTEAHPSPLHNSERDLQDVHQPIDFLSVDVEGFEFNVLNGLNLDAIRPRVIVMEQSPSDQDSPAVKLLASHGYVPRCHLGSNSVYTQANDEGTFYL